MKKKFGIKLLLSIIILVAVILPIIVIGKDYGAEYDEIFGGGSFTIHTNELSDSEIENYQLSNILYSFVQRYNTNTLYENGEEYNYIVFVRDCDALNMTCDIGVNKHVRTGDYNYESKDFKMYEDVSINVNTDVSSYFSNLLDEDGNIVIQYDESMFANAYDKNTYINNYFTSKQFTNKDGNHVSYSYNSNDKILTYSIYDYNNYNFDDYFLARIVVNDVIFDSTEKPYSDDFKLLSDDGNLTVKTNGDFTVAMLSQYLNTFYVNNSGKSIHFSVDGNIVNNKVYIKMIETDNSGKTVKEEKHLINLVKDTNIDHSVFNSIGLDGKIEIPALEPESNLNEYIINYMNAINYTTLNITDNIYYYFSYIYPYDGSNKHFIKFEKYNNGEIIDVQFNEVEFDFVGYSNDYSLKYEEKFNNGIVVRSDEQNIESVRSNLEYGYAVLSCNNEVSVCDIALSHNEEKKIEIHKVNVTFDNSISDLFKQVFNLKEDGTIDILTDVDLDENNYFSYYTYDNKLEISMDYYKQGDKIQLSLNSWNGNGFERHSVYYNLVNGSATSYYKSLVNMNKDFYPGENDKIMEQLTWNGQFAYDVRNSYGINTLNCDRDTKKCKVMVLNDKKQLEIHEVTANIKEGKSPEFSAAFPSENITFNAIYKDDSTYLYGASMAYFMSKTKDWIYLNDFTKDTARVVFNDLEIHTFNVNYVEANEKYAEEVSNAKKLLENANLDTIRTDLEYINRFYYSNGDFFSSENFNSKTLNDKFRETVKNNHIGYYVVPEGGGGMPFLSGAAGKLVLFYDGVAYDILDDYVDFTNHNIIYIPSNTEKTPEAYIAAAQKRINDYLGENSGVVISYTGSLDDDMKDFFKEEGYETFGIDKNNFDHNEYSISYLDNTEGILIIADSSKMQKPDFAAMDVTENISVTSDTVNYPSNTVVMSDIITSKDSKYNEILEKAKIKNAHIVDINLYSLSIGDIKDFEDAEFDVSVPIKNEGLLNKELVAYYIDEEGNVESHPVVMDGFMANFETTHFSTYIIAEKSENKNLENATQDVIKNPNTGDNVLTYVLLTVVSGLGIATCFYILNKKEN